MAAKNPSSAPKSKDSLSVKISVSIKAQNQDSQKVFKLALFFFYMHVLLLQLKQSKSRTEVAKTWEDSPYMFIIRTETNQPVQEPASKSSIKRKILIRLTLTVIMRFYVVIN